MEGVHIHPRNPPDRSTVSPARLTKEFQPFPVLTLDNLDPNNYVERASEEFDGRDIDGFRGDQTDCLEIDFWFGSGGGVDIAEGGCESECAGEIGVRVKKSYKGIASGHKDGGEVVGVKYKVLLLRT